MLVQKVRYWLEQRYVIIACNHRVCTVAGRDEALVSDAKKEPILMYTSPKILASLNATEAFAQVIGQNCSQATWCE